MPPVYRPLSEVELIDLARLATKSRTPVLVIGAEVQIRNLMAKAVSAAAAIEKERLILLALSKLDTQKPDNILLDEPAKNYLTEAQIQRISASVPLSKRNMRDLPVPMQRFRLHQLKDRAPAALIRILGAAGYLATARIICTDDEGHQRRLIITARRKPLVHLTKGDAPYRMVWGIFVPQFC